MSKRPAEPEPTSGGRTAPRDDASPMELRRAFLRGHPWEAVVQLNRAACTRLRAQHGPNPDAEPAVAREWSRRHTLEFTFAEVVDFLFTCHRRSPFLFENAVTFADLARQLIATLPVELAPRRRREIAAAVADFVTGVLDREAMVEIVEGLWREVAFRPGDRVKTLRGAAHGVVLAVRADGQIAWRPRGSESELVTGPDGLLRVTPRP